jgi:hypothetical protein
MKHFLSALVIVFLICSSAKGEEITFSFRGTIHELDGEFSSFSGQPFEIVYSFERKTDDANPKDPKSGNYIGAIKSGTLTIFNGSKSLKWVIAPDGPHNIIEVKKLDTSDSYKAGVSVSGPAAGSEIPAYFLIELMDGNATALSNDKLPSSLDLRSFDLRTVQLTFVGIRQTISSTLGIITSGSAPIQP